MSSWADESEDPPLEQAPAEYTGGGGVRPRLHLQPRSADADKKAQDVGGGGSKSNPFGAAKPREQGEKERRHTMMRLWYSFSAVICLCAYISFCA